MELTYSFNILGEIINDGLTHKGTSKKLFDDTLDSGISESSNFEAHKEKSKYSSAGKEIRIKQERESSVESSRKMQAKPSKSRKRKISGELEITPILKKVKSEPTSPTRDELELELTPQISSKKKDRKSTSFVDRESFDNTLIGSTPKEKQKKSRRDKEDDFETSLQLLIDSARIKSEKTSK